MNGLVLLLMVGLISNPMKVYERQACAEVLFLNRLEVRNNNKELGNEE